MYALSLGVQRINEILPSPVYALLSGLNSATVGIIALAAVQLAEKAVKEKLTRILVIMGGVAGLCYNALWYFPLLMAIGGVAAVVWDGWLGQKVRKLRVRFADRRRETSDGEIEGTDESIVLEDGRDTALNTVQRRAVASQPQATPESSTSSARSNSQTLPQPEPAEDKHVIRMRNGLFIALFFFSKHQPFPSTLL
jgi:hypothetical protein